jgi:hypothetical protein
LDLRYLNNFDEIEFRRRVKGKRIALVRALDKKVLVELLDWLTSREVVYEGSSDPDLSRL